MNGILVWLAIENSHSIRLPLVFGFKGIILIPGDATAGGTPHI